MEKNCQNFKGLYAIKVNFSIAKKKILLICEMQLKLYSNFNLEFLLKFSEVQNKYCDIDEYKKTVLDFTINNIANNICKYI